MAIIHSLILIGSLLLSFSNVHCAANWKPASITFYGNADYNNDPYALTDGTCSCKKAKLYGICYNNWCFDSIGGPKLVAAINTRGIGNTVMCGKCVEIKCTVGRYRGLSWSEFGSTNVCFDMKKRVVLQITDSCPEGHKNPNNIKYCDIKHRHFDVSFWAFAYIAPHKFGVVDIDYRFVKCPQDLKKSLGVVNNTCCRNGAKCMYGQ